MSMLQTYWCHDCGAEFDMLSKDGVTLSLDRTDDLPLCPDCNSPRHERVLKVPHGIGLGDVAGAGRHYPYFDRNLGMELRSASHRNRVCRELGIRPAETKDACTAQRKAEKAEAAAREASCVEYERALEERPDFRGYRELRDKGYFAPTEMAKRFARMQKMEP